MPDKVIDQEIATKPETTVPLDLLTVPRVRAVPFSFQLKCNSLA